MVKRGMTKGDVAMYLTMDVTRIYTAILGVWRAGGIMHSSYPEDTAGKQNFQDNFLYRNIRRFIAVYCNPQTLL